MNGFFDPTQYQQVEKVSEQYTRMPNYIIDDKLMAQLSDKALKCLLFIVRQTIGFDKTSNKIATIQFQDYCGIKKDRNVFAAIKELEQCNLIKVERKTGVLNTYSLIQNQYPQRVLPEDGTTTPKGQGTTTPKGQGTTTPKGHTTKENSKENLKKDMCDGFLEFWETYPKCKRKGSKTDAMKTFEKYKSHTELINQVLKLFKSDDQWLKQDGEFIPSPSSWLNKKHWENDFWLERINPQQSNNPNQPEQPKQITTIKKQWRGMNDE